MSVQTPLCLIEGKYLQKDIKVAEWNIDGLTVLIDDLFHRIVAHHLPFSSHNKTE